VAPVAAVVKREIEHVAAPRAETPWASLSTGGDDDISAGCNSSDDTSRGTKPAQASNSRKERVAAACRRFRARRKEEMAQLKRKNHELEVERDELLDRIALLQTETQTLRDHGTIDLGRENELLRSEIHLHKRFIATIVASTNVACGVPAAERVRIITAGLGSAAGQCIGLCYTSIVDPSWRAAIPVRVLGRQVFARVQHLPLALKETEARRINMRFDFVQPYGSAKDIVDNTYNIYGNFKKLHERLRETWLELNEEPDDRGIAEEVDISQGDPDLSSEDLKIFHVTRKIAATNLQTSFVSFVGRKDAMLFPSALNESIRTKYLPGVADTEPLRAYMVVNTTNETMKNHVASLVPDNFEDVLALTKPFYHSLCAIDLPSNRGVLITSVASFPVDDRLVKHDKDFKLPLITEEGSLRPRSLKRLRSTVALVACSFGPDGEVDLSSLVNEMATTRAGDSAQPAAGPARS